MFAKILSLILHSVILILNIVCLSYIYKLEKTGCACADSKYRKFLKGYMMFAIVYLVLAMIVTGSLHPEALAGSLGKGSPLAYVLVIVNLVFTIATVAFFIMAILYVRRLVQEKCACSEDVRREVLYYWPIIHMSLLAIIILLPLVATILLGAVGVVSSNFNGKKLAQYKKDADTIILDPVDSVKKAVKTVKEQAKRVTK